MTHRDEVGRRVEPAPAVGDPDRGAGQLARRAVDEHHRQAAPDLGLEEGMVPAARHDHQAVHRPGQQPVDQILLTIRIGVGADRQDQAALRARDPFHGPVEHGGERVADVLQDQAHRGGPSVRAAQRVGGVVAPVAQLGGGRQDPLPGPRGRADLVVDHPGHRFEADAGGPGHVVHGGAAQAISHRAGSCPSDDFCIPRPGRPPQATGDPLPNRFSAGPGDLRCGHDHKEPSPAGRPALVHRGAGL